MNSTSDNGEKKNKRQLQAEASKEKIYKHAIKLFSSVGYEETSIADICKSAGVSKGLFYNYFPTKSSVMTYTIERVDLTYQQFYDKLPKDLNCYEKLCRLTYEIIDASVNTKTMIERARIVYSEEALGNVSTLYNPQRRIFQLIRMILDEGIESGEFRIDLPCRLAIETLITFTWGSILHIISLDVNKSHEKSLIAAHEGIRLICSGFLSHKG